jgi:hypothetical protein
MEYIQVEVDWLFGPLGCLVFHYVCHIGFARAHGGLDSHGLGSRCVHLLAASHEITFVAHVKKLITSGSAFV